ncbi:MAG TPA: hypothetical protein PKA64_20980 [Myxococcota bacterium]|nr:hypothetical protein [Myxococcota bacterium]
MHPGVRGVIALLSFLTAALWPLVLGRVRPAAARWLTLVPPAVLLGVAAGWGLAEWLHPASGPWCWDLPTFEPPPERRCVDRSAAALQAAAVLGQVVHLATALALLPAQPHRRWMVGCAAIAGAALVGIGHVMLASDWLSADPVAEPWGSALLWTGGDEQLALIVAGWAVGGALAWRGRR